MNVRKLATALILGLSLAAVIGFASASPFRSGPAEAAGIEPATAPLDAPVPAADNCLAGIGLPSNLGVGLGAVVTANPLLGLTSSTQLGIGVPDVCTIVPTTMGIVTGLLGGLPLGGLPIIGTPASP
jgi:hypothetical protein